MVEPEPADSGSGSATLNWHHLEVKLYLYCRAVHPRHRSCHRVNDAKAYKLSVTWCGKLVHINYLLSRGKCQEFPTFIRWEVPIVAPRPSTSIPSPLLHHLLLPSFITSSSPLVPSLPLVTPILPSSSPPSSPLSP